MLVSKVSPREWKRFSDIFYFFRSLRTGQSFIAPRSLIYCTSLMYLMNDMKSTVRCYGYIAIFYALLNIELGINSWMFLSCSENCILDKIYILVMLEDIGLRRVWDELVDWMNSPLMNTRYSEVRFPNGSSHGNVTCNGSPVNCQKLFLKRIYEKLGVLIKSSDHLEA